MNQELNSKLRQEKIRLDSSCPLLSLLLVLPSYIVPFRGTLPGQTIFVLPLVSDSIRRFYPRIQPIDQIYAWAGANLE